MHSYCSIYLIDWLIDWLIDLIDWCLMPSLAVLFESYSLAVIAIYLKIIWREII